MTETAGLVRGPITGAERPHPRLHRVTNHPSSLSLTVGHGTRPSAPRVLASRMTLGQRVAQNLRAMRLQRKLAQESLAEKAGLSVSYISMLERGQRSPPLDTLEALAKALGVSPIALLQELPRQKASMARR